MNEGPSDPAKPPGPEPASKPPGSRFEDLSDLEVPGDAVATGQRTPILITAAVVLFAGALFAVLYLVLLLPFASSDRGSSVSAVVVGFLLVYGALQAVAGLLVVLLRQSGRGTPDRVHLLFCHSAHLRRTAPVGKNIRGGVPARP